MQGLSENFISIEPPSERPQLNPDITVSILEKAVHQKAGRPADLAKRLKTTEDHIRTLLKEPGIKVQTAAKGWLKPKAA